MMQVVDRARAVAEVFAQPGPVLLAAPLGLGKPNHLLNALYAEACRQPDRAFSLFTALSLAPPQPSADLERRFLQPFLARHFGSDYPRLQYVDDQRSGRLPEHIKIHEFYLQSGAMLKAPTAQADYISLNYTHVARAVAERGVTALVQLLARDPESGRLSFSCNPDLTLDLLDEVKALGHRRPLLIAEVHDDLPFMEGSALVPEGLFDYLVEPCRAASSGGVGEASPSQHPLFALPRQPVSDAEYAIGFYASTLVRDGGSLQIGIGALSDALTHALVLRQTRNADYRRIIQALWPEVESSELVCRWGGLGEFERGLFGASEMLMDGFCHLVDAGVVKRPVVDDLDLMQRIHDGSASEADQERLRQEGQILHGGFFLGSKDLYQWLRQLPDEQRGRIRMTRISHINELYGGQEALERLQRREARFFNTCMMSTLLGAAVSDALEDGRVVSGIGGQYNFVAMAHALRESRSILMFRGRREAVSGAQSGVVYNYGHTSIPRHLRDVVINEYGIADLRGRSDSECIAAMLAISDAEFAPRLAEQARAAGKCGEASMAEARVKQAQACWSSNRPDALRDCLARFRAEGLLPDYPLGCDFTAEECRLVTALGWLKQRAQASKPKLLIEALFSAPAEVDGPALQRMGLAKPASIGERLQARLLRLALARTQVAAADDGTHIRG